MERKIPIKNVIPHLKPLQPLSPSSCFFHKKKRKEKKRKEKQ